MTDKYSDEEHHYSNNFEVNNFCVLFYKILLDTFVAICGYTNAVLKLVYWFFSRSYYVFK